MRGIAEFNKFNHRIIDSKLIQNTLVELRKPLTKESKKRVVNGAMGFVVLASALVIATPLVRAHLQSTTSAVETELATEQEATAHFLTLNTEAINIANTTLGEIYTYIHSGYREEQRILLENRYQELLSYQTRLISNESVYQASSKNTIQKISMLLIAMDAFFNMSTPYEEDLLQLNIITNEFKKASEQENLLLVELLNTMGISYDVLPNGQIQYEYLKSTD